MVRDLGRAQPVAPEIDRGVQRAERLVQASRNVAAPPGQRDEGRLALGERRTRNSGHSSRQREVPPPRGVYLPPPGQWSLRRSRPTYNSMCRRSPRIELRATPRRSTRPLMHVAIRTSAPRRRNQPEPGEVRSLSLVLDRADGPEILDGHPSRRRLPGRFQHHRPRHVPAVLRNAGIAGTEPEHPAVRSRRAPKTLGESGRGRHSHSTARPVRPGSSARSSQEPVIGNRRERAHRNLASCSQDRNVWHLASFHRRDRAGHASTRMPGDLLRAPPSGPAWSASAPRPSLPSRSRHNAQPYVRIWRSGMCGTSHLPGD